MPSINKGESEKDYVSRCIPIRMKEKGEDASQAAAACHGMYKQHKEKGTQYETEYKEFTFDIEFSFSNNDGSKLEFAPMKEYVKDGQKWTEVDATAVIGNRVMRGVYVPYEELKKSIDSWNGTFHDYNHMATSFGEFNQKSNIEYVIGYQDSAIADDVTKAIRMKIHINNNHPKYQYWKSYVDTCKAAGKTPNVSMSVFAKTKPMKTSGLENCDDYSEDESIPYMYDIKPRALTTALEGVCNDKNGCGIGIGYEKECNDCKECECKSVGNAEEKSESKPEDAEKIAQLAKRIKSLKENV
jgi:hypothetical protein